MEKDFSVCHQVKSVNDKKGAAQKRDDIFKSVKDESDKNNNKKISNYCLAVVCLQTPVKLQSTLMSVQATDCIRMMDKR